MVQRGYTRPPSLYDERLKEMPAGHYLRRDHERFGAMPDHASQIKVTDRWAIVAYVRALQLSASGTIDDVPPANAGRLDQPAGAENGNVSGDQRSACGHAERGPCSRAPEIGGQCEREAEPRQSVQEAPAAAERG